MRIAGGTANRITKRIINFILVMSVSGFAFPGVGLIYPGISASSAVQASTCWARGCGFAPFV